MRDYAGPNPALIEKIGRELDGLLVAEKEASYSYDHKVSYVGSAENGILPPQETCTLAKVRERILACQRRLAEAAGGTRVKSDGIRAEAGR